MHSHPSLRESLSRSDIFAGISVDKLTGILNLGHQGAYKTGEALFFEGDPALHFYLVLDGRFKLSKLHENGKEAIVRYINSGEMTAAISAFKKKKYPVTAYAVETSTAVAWDRETMMEMIIHHPEIGINLLGMVIERMDDIQNRYLELQAERVEQRIARALLRIMKQSGRIMEDGILIDFRLSRQDIADYTGTTLFTVSRILSNWEKKRWVRSAREKITIVNPHALVAFSESG